jgi:thiol-disulfide isomerase/thioredoxin
VKQLEKLMVNGNLTIVFVKAEWCGACHRFNDEVWSPLTKLKNRSMNLAAVDSEMIGQTSLANVPRKYYPTLLLVGKDKKPATFIDEDGSPTNAMPRNASLDDDREALSNLVQTPKNKLNTLSPTTPIVAANSASIPMNAKSAANFANARSAPLSMNSVNTRPVNNSVNSVNTRPVNNSVNSMNSVNTRPVNNSVNSVNSVNSIEPYSMEEVSMKP